MNFAMINKRLDLCHADALKRRLDECDYKIIKCAEYKLAGKDLPYDITVLHTERQALRDKINALEGD